MRFSVAVAQMESAWLKPVENLAKAEKFIGKAVSRKAGVVIFPEEFITGALGELGKKRKKFIDFDGKYLEHFRALAKQYKIDIVPGSWYEGEKGKLFNTAYYIDRKGKVKGKYRKNNLWLSEKSYGTPGKTAPVFKTRFGKAGLAICWDLAFPLHYQRMAKKGAKIIFQPSLWGSTYNGKPVKYNPEERHVDAMCVSRAFENNIILAYCNATGKVKKIGKALGHSQVTVPLKGALKKLGTEEKMFVQEIDLSILKEAELAYRNRKDLKRL